MPLLKTGTLKMEDWKMKDQMAVVKNARPEKGGPENACRTWKCRNTMYK